MNVLEFYNWDHQKTLFPLEASKLAIQYGSDEFCNYLKEGNQLALQTPVCALKKNGDARFTVKLDPVLDYAFYDLVLRNQKFFHPLGVPGNFVKGYFFDEGRPSSIAHSYNEFCETVNEGKRMYSHFLRVDIKSCFDSIDLNDFNRWIEGVGFSVSDIELLNRCFLSINPDGEGPFLPQGIYPAKLLGSHYLSFIEGSRCIASEFSVRFLDDVYVFSNSLASLEYDYSSLKNELALRGLRFNEEKTYLGRCDSGENVSRKRRMEQLLNKKRLQCFEISDGESLFEGTVSRISASEHDFVFSKISTANFDEHDVDLLLTFLREDVGIQVPLFKHILYTYPSHSKSLYYFSKYIRDSERMASVLTKFIRDSEDIPEYQLFWVTKIALYLKSLGEINDALLTDIFKHPSSSLVIKAKVMEEHCDEMIWQFGIDQIKESESNLVLWCIAFGQIANDGSFPGDLREYLDNDSPIKSMISRTIRNLTSSNSHFFNSCGLKK